MLNKKRLICYSLLMALLLSLSGTQVFAGTVVDPSTDQSSNTFSVESVLPPNPGNIETTSSTGVLQSGGANIGGILVNQKQTDTTAGDNYLQLYDDVNAWGRMNTLKGFWNVNLPNNGFISQKNPDNKQRVKKLLGLKDASAEAAINPSNLGTTPGNGVEVNGVQSTSNLQKTSPNYPFLQTEGINVRGLIVNQGGIDQEADDSKIQLYDYINIWGYTNVRDGIWNANPDAGTIGAPSSDALLSSMSVNVGTLNPSFDANTTNYSLTASYIQSTMNVTPSAAEGSTITVNGAAVNSGQSKSIPLSVGNNTITLAVTAEDGVSKNTYAITATRKAQGTLQLSTENPSATAIAITRGQNGFLGQYKLVATGEDVYISTIMLQNTGTATSADIKNLQLFTYSKITETFSPMSDIVQLNASKAAQFFWGNPVRIPKNSSMTIYLQDSTPCTATLNKTFAPLIGTDVGASTTQGNTYKTSGSCS